MQKVDQSVDEGLIWFNWSELARDHWDKVDAGVVKFAVVVDGLELTRFFFLLLFLLRWGHHFTWEAKQVLWSHQFAFLLLRFFPFSFASWFIIDHLSSSQWRNTLVSLLTIDCFFFSSRNFCRLQIWQQLLIHYWVQPFDHFLCVEDILMDVGTFWIEFTGWLLRHVSFNPVDALAKGGTVGRLLVCCCVVPGCEWRTGVWSFGSMRWSFSLCYSFTSFL